MRILASLIMILFGSRALATSGERTLYSIAQASLLENVIDLSAGPVLRAGAHQFASLWTRDFCFSARGLWALGREDVIASQLSLLLQNLRAEDGLVPRVLDSKPSWQRVARYSFVPFRPNSPDVKDDLKPEFKGEHGTVAIDSNAMVLITAFEYAQKSGDQAWFEQYKPQLKRVLDFYRPWFEKGLVEQGKYADWQDSVKREGATFFTNFVVWKALKEYAQDDFFEINAHVVTAFRQHLEETFYVQASGLYRSLSHGPWISLDGMLMALEDQSFLSVSRRQQLYAALVKSPLWGVTPGIPTYPEYPRDQISITTKIAGLRHYHDGVLWPWLTAYSAKVARLMGDEASARRIEGQLQVWAKRDGAINEVLEPKKKMRPFRRMFYRSEAPFSWGAAFVLDMLSQKVDQ